MYLPACTQFFNTWRTYLHVAHALDNHTLAYPLPGIIIRLLHFDLFVLEKLGGGDGEGAQWRQLEN